jgi:exosortase E/protease (VPEID-CTERM system)
VDGENSPVSEPKGYVFPFNTRAQNVNRFRNISFAEPTKSSGIRSQESDFRQLLTSVLVRRLGALAVLFAFELAAITFWLDGPRLAGHGGLTRLFRDWGPSILRGIVAFVVVFATFACLRFQTTLTAISGRMAPARIQWRLFSAHAAALALFSFLSILLYASGPSLRQDLLAFAWTSTGLFAIGFGATAFIRPAVWTQTALATGHLWILALLAALAAAIGGNAITLLWQPATRVTFWLVRILLRPAGTFFANPSTMTVGNSRFSVIITSGCSGLEGIGLILAFTIVWLILFRRECRYPQALILLPAGIAIIFLLNSVRIAALVLVGNAGFEGVAAGGMHSQAGWIAFNLVALGISLAAREVSWISATRPAPTVEKPVALTLVNPTAKWIVPFILILAAGMAARAASAGFEWLYPLRFIAAAAALWVFRRQYRSLDWRVDWMAPAAGLLAFAIWIGFGHSVPGSAPQPLAAASSTAAFCWLTFRVMAAVVTVPIAEELAFRGFLLRRFISSDFEAVSFRQFSWVALLSSSLIFGALHGSRWIVGSLAGALYALAVLRRGRFGNAIVAHATTNALLALDVLAFHHWDLW